MQVTMDTKPQRIGGFLDFCGNHKLDFSKVNPHEVSHWIENLNRKGLSVLVMEKDPAMLDKIALHTAYAFSTEQLTSDQVITLLDWRAMMLEFAEVKIVPLLDSFGQLTEDAIRFFTFNNIDNKELDQLTTSIKLLPQSEQCLFSLTDNTDLDSTSNLRTLAEGLKLIHSIVTPIGRSNQGGPRPQISDGIELPPDGIVNSQPLVTFITLTAGIRTILTQRLFGLDAKSIYPRLGEMGIDDIDRSMRSKGRYIELDFPGIKKTGSFHNIKAKSFYLSLHDELHRQLTSSIPNPCYEALFSAIDVVREKTGIRWSKEIWNATDCEVSEFLFLDKAQRNNKSIESVSNQFKRLIDASILSENRLVGLFSDNPLLETNWILMIDMFFRKDFWLTKGIDPNEFEKSSAHGEIYDFIVRNESLINDKQSPAEQVFIMMNLYLSEKGSHNVQEYSDEIRFSKQKGDNYLQLRRNQKLCFISKQGVLEHSKIYCFAIRNNISLSRLSDKIINALKDDKIKSLIRDKIISVKQLEKLSLESLEILKDDEIIESISANIISIDKLDTIPQKIMERSKNSNIQALIRLNILTLKGMEELSQKTIDVLKNYSIRKLITDNILSIAELETLSQESIKSLDNFNFQELIRLKILSLEQLEKLPLKTIEALKEYNIRKLIRDNLLSIEMLETLSPKTIEGLKDYYISILIQLSKLSVEQLEKLSQKTIEGLKDFNIYYLIQRSQLSVEQLEKLFDNIKLDLSEIVPYVEANIISSVKENPQSKNISCHAHTFFQNEERLIDSPNSDDRRNDDPSVPGKT